MTSLSRFDEFAASFPNLGGSNYRVTSPKDGAYNCIAHAAGEDDKWWDPSNFPLPGFESLHRQVGEAIRSVGISVATRRLQR